MAESKGRKVLPALWGRVRAAAMGPRKISCADCPIIMSCGREPTENCLARLEALAGGHRRLPMPYDTMIVETTR